MGGPGCDARHLEPRQKGDGADQAAERKPCPKRCRGEDPALRACARPEQQGQEQRRPGVTEECRRLWEAGEKARPRREREEQQSPPAVSPGDPQDGETAHREPGAGLELRRPEE